MALPPARRFLPLALVALLAACGGASVPPMAAQAETASISTEGAPTGPAKRLFGAVAAPTGGAATPIGFYSKGCMAGAVSLPETGPTWQAMRLSRNRTWGQPATISFIEDLSRYAASLPGWSGLYVGDISQPRGGPMATGHASHQIGLDVDIWMNPGGRMNLSAEERENASAIDMQRAGGAYVNGNWTPAHEALLRHAAEDPRVARIFVFAGAKVHMCDTATGDRTWLHKIRPWYGHNDHFHVRLNCPPGASDCRTQDPIPPGDGCADARAWVDGILHPPPPDPNAPPAPPKRDLTLADLPGQCTAVLGAP